MPWAYAAAAAGGALLSSDMGGSDVPMSGVVARSASNNQQIGEDVWGWYKSKMADMDSAANGANAVALNRAGTQLQTSDSALKNGADSYDQYSTSFAPINTKIATDALNYDTPERRDAAAAQAQADVSSAGDAARATLAREVQSRGGDVNSGNYVATLGKMGISEAAQKATAGNTARRAVEDTGAARLASAATLGQQVANQSATQTQLGLTAGNSAVTNSQVPLTTLATRSSVLSQGASTAAGANKSAADIQLARYNAETGQNNTEGSTSNGLMSAIGSGVGAYFASDKKIKKDVKPANDEQAMDSIRLTNVKRWRYKKGSVADDGGKEHIGPMAQDVRRNMGDRVAPGGKVIDVVSMNGITLAAVKNLDKRMARVERKLSKH